MNDGIIYLDHQATTPVDPQVVAAMTPFWGDRFANPSSPHRAGRLAADVLRRARRQVCGALGARHATEIVFTSGGTEANQLAVTGVVANGRHRAAGHIVTTVIEHRSVLSACEWAASAGGRVTMVPVDRHGLVDPRHIDAAITDRTALVSVMYANNEIGTIQPMAEIAAITRRHGVPLHVDAVQATPAMALDVDALGADLVTISAHKIYGPKGVGALYVRRGTTIRAPYAGSQEHGMRAGTVNLPGVVGLAEALRLLSERRRQDNDHAMGLRDHMAQRLLTAIPRSYINGCTANRLPGNLSITMPGVNTADLLEAVPDVAIGTGAACAGGHQAVSHVLAAIGLDQAHARATLRISVGRGNDRHDVDRAIARLTAAVATIRARAA